MATKVTPLFLQPAPEEVSSAVELRTLRRGTVVGLVLIAFLNASLLASLLTAPLFSISLVLAGFDDATGWEGDLHTDNFSGMSVILWRLPDISGELVKSRAGAGGHLGPQDLRHRVETEVLPDRQVTAGALAFLAVLQLLLALVGLLRRRRLSEGGALCRALVIFSLAEFPLAVIVLSGAVTGYIDGLRVQFAYGAALVVGIVILAESIAVVSLRHGDHGRARTVSRGFVSVAIWSLATIAVAPLADILLWGVLVATVR